MAKQVPRCTSLAYRRSAKQCDETAKKHKCRTLGFCKLQPASQRPLLVLQRGAARRPSSIDGRWLKASVSSICWRPESPVLASALWLFPVDSAARITPYPIAVVHSLTQMLFCLVLNRRQCLVPSLADRTVRDVCDLAFMPNK